MFRPEVVLGPPGCGKTTELLRRMQAELERPAGQRVPLSEIAFVTFTRAARKQAQLKAAQVLGLDRAELPWFRTIHSAAFHLLGLTREDVMGREPWREFAKHHGYQLSKLGPSNADPGADPAPPPRTTADDDLRFLSEWRQNCRLTPQEALRRTPLSVSTDDFERFERRLAAFKREHGVLGFADMLERVLEAGRCPPVRVAFVDEAQDLSPLQIAVVERWFASCQRVHVAGDDDQAIYSFQGADPKWLLSLSGRQTPVVLGQSYRVPANVHALAQSVIRRNSRRQPKVYLPRQELGRVRHLDESEAIDLVDGSVSTFVLARNRFYLRSVASDLIERGVPFVVEGGGARSPLNDRRLVRAFKAVLRLRAGAPGSTVPAAELDAALSFVPKSSRLVPEGTRQRVGALLQMGGGFWFDQLSTQLGLGPFLEVIARDGPGAVLVNAEPQDVRYLEAVHERHEKLPTQVVLTSIHGAKGREASRVVLLPAMTKATFGEFRQGGQSGFESENRVAYVGVTRAIDDLVIVRPRGRRRYDFPSVTGGAGAAPAGLGGTT